MSLAAIVLVYVSPAFAGGSVRRTLKFDGDCSDATIPSLSAPNLLTPGPCRTPYFTAGLGDVAIVTAGVTVSPASNTSSDLRLAVTLSTPLNPYLPVNEHAQRVSMNIPTATMKAQAVVPLAEDTTYSFGAGLAADTATETAACFCQGVVVVVSPATAGEP